MAERCQLTLFDCLGPSSMRQRQQENNTDNISQDGSTETPEQVSRHYIIKLLTAYDP